MQFLGVLMVVFSGSISMQNVITTFVYCIGLGLIFKKCGLKVWSAWVPCYRDYQLARCADMEYEGRILFVGQFLKTIAALAVFGSLVSTRFTLFVMVVDLVIGLTLFFYSIRIYMGLSEVFGLKSRWAVLWTFFRFVPALIWGFSSKFQPQWTVDEIEKDKAIVVSGQKAEVMADGLTVNLEDRTVREFLTTKTLLRDIHLTIQPGHMVMLLGGSGAGKTTLINAIIGYEKAHAEVMLDGENVYHQYKQMQYEVGFVPQQDLMRGEDTVYNTLMDAAALRLPQDFSHEDRKKRVHEVMEMFGLLPIEKSLVDKLSGGQRKRLSIAMEFISNPNLFILDEPDSGLDGVMARDLMTRLRHVADQGKIVIVITHTPDRVADLFDDLIVLAKDAARTGRLAFYGSMDEAREFFDTDRMERIVMRINREEEDGEGRADEFIQKYMEVQHAGCES